MHGSKLGMKTWDWAQMREEPYRLLFPLGWASAVIGLGVWIPFYLMPSAFPYPGQGHALIQIQGFLLCFVLGFLCTMLPKVLGIKPLGPMQFAIFPLGIVAILAAALAAGTDPAAALAAQLVHFLLLANFFVFIASRWRARKNNPPPAFVFIALAMLADVTGTLLRIAALSHLIGGVASAQTLRAAILLQYQGFPVLLILGVGGFLLPKLLAQGPLDPAALRAQAAPSLWASAGMGLLFLAGYGLEAWAPQTATLRLAAALRAGVWAWFLFARLRLHKTPAGLPAYLAGARYSLFAMGFGFLMPVFLPAYLVAWEHVVFITGFVWLTLSVAARVTAAHGGRLDILQGNRKKTVAYALLLILAVLTRVSTDIWTKGHWLHLALASGFALAALILWARIYAPALARRA